VPQPRRSDFGGCTLVSPGASDPASGTSPGVFVHAAAIETVLTESLVRPVPAAGRAVAAAGMAIGGGLLGFSLAPVFGAAAVITLAALCLGASPMLLGFGLWFPAVLPAGAAIAAIAVAYVVRFVIEDRRRRR